MFTLSVVGPELSLSDCCGMGGGEAGESFRPPTTQRSCELFLHAVNGRKNSQKLNLAVITGSLNTALSQLGNPVL